MQLIPVRGRKPGISAETYDSYIDAAYPREGTETKVIVCFLNCMVMQLIPARGRKR